MSARYSNADMRMGSSGPVWEFNKCTGEVNASKAEAQVNVHGSLFLMLPAQAIACTLCLRMC